MTLVWVLSVVIAWALLGIIVALVFGRIVRAAHLTTPIQRAAALPQYARETATD